MEAAKHDEINIEVAEGLISGPEKWEQILQEMLFAFDYHVNGDLLGTKQQDDFYKRWCYKNPHAKIPENRSVSYVYNMTDKYREEQEAKSPFTKPFGGLASECTSDEPDLHIKEPDHYELVGESVHYYDVKYEMEISRRAQKGFELFGRFFTSLWD
jgi:hypothetical protein